MSLGSIISSSKKEIIIGVIVTIIGSIPLGGWSWAKSLIFPQKDLNGVWTVYVTTDKTNYKPFKNLTSIFTFNITQLKDEITGNGEKVRDINPDGSETRYSTVQRDQVKYTGKIDQSNFGKATVHLTIDCKGLRFKSTAAYDLTVINKDSITGTFQTTIADGSGHIVMKREK